MVVSEHGCEPKPCASIELIFCPMGSLLPRGLCVNEELVHEHREYEMLYKRRCGAAFVNKPEFTISSNVIISSRSVYWRDLSRNGISHQRQVHGLS